MAVMLVVAGVRSIVSQLIKGKQKAVVIQADKNVATELLVQVIDESKRAGASNESIATQ